MIWLFIILNILIAVFLNRNAGSIRMSKKSGLIIDVTPALCSSLFFFIILILSSRPLFSLLISLSGSFLLWLINRIKQGLFHEPVTFMDLFLIPQIFRHPKFYLPYIIPLRVTLPLIICLSFFIVISINEPVMPQEMKTASWISFSVVIISSLFVAFLFLKPGEKISLSILDIHPLTLDPDQDLKKYGLLGSALLQSLWHRHLRNRPGNPSIPYDHVKPPDIISWKKDSLDSFPDKFAPHIILIQAESFFDLRALDPQIDPHLLENFDSLSQSALSGRLMVSSHGAYTMRTEFSVLTGIPLERLGTERLNPYVETKRRPVWSIARHLNQIGYQNQFIHPFDLTFFKRHLVMPNLGFNEIIHQGQFHSRDKIGPYVGDVAMGQFILRQVKDSKEPLFIFGVTIEAHGPWDKKRLKTLPHEPKPRMPDWATPELEIYLRHMKNTDRMLGLLAKGLLASNRPTILCLYGDHPGSIPSIYTRTGHPGNYTPYIIWSENMDKTKETKDILPEEIGGIILKQAMVLQKRV